VQIPRVQKCPESVLLAQMILCLCRNIVVGFGRKHRKTTPDNLQEILLSSGNTFVLSVSRIINTEPNRRCVLLVQSACQTQATSPNGLAQGL